MINLFIAKNNCGKTTLLNKKMSELKDNSEKCIFFPVGNEILASINNEESKSNNIKYENPLYRVINDVIKSNEDPKDGEFEKLKSKYSSFLKKLIDDYSQSTNSYEIINNKFDDMLKQNFDDNKLIQRIDFLPIFKVKKGDDNISTGEWQISNIFCSIKWLKLLKDNIKLHIFFDEPETYLHPQYIEILCSEIMELNNTKKIDFYIATHNPQIIRNLINGVEKNKINIYVRKTPYDDNSKPNNINDLFEKQENISTDQMYKSANYILAEIFDVYTIEYFDELLGEIHDSHNDVYNMISGRSDR